MSVNKNLQNLLLKFYQQSFILQFIRLMAFVNQENLTELKHFLPLMKLGQGAFSTVYKVKRIHDGQIYALKKIKMQQLKHKQKQNALNEIRILASIKSKFIISYKEAFYDHTLNLLCIVMQFASKGDMQKWIENQKQSGKKFSQSQIWKAAGDILIGLLQLHEQKILHRDLKTANVFISEDTFKLGDLNVSKINNGTNQLAKTQTGTPYYASPQVWRDQPYNNKCDIWSFGCLIYELCTFAPPFQGNDLDQLFTKVQKGYYAKIPYNYSNQLNQLIKDCLIVNPTLRLNAKMLIQKYPKLKWKFLQSLQKNQIQISQNMLNTIKLPINLKDLTRSLPVPEYKEELLKKRQNRKQKGEPFYQIETKKQEDFKKAQVIKIEPLPERIKRYFDEKKYSQETRLRLNRSKRPTTGNKIKMQISDTRRPVSSSIKPQIQKSHQIDTNKQNKALRNPVNSSAQKQAKRPKVNRSKRVISASYQKSSTKGNRTIQKLESDQKRFIYAKNNNVRSRKLKTQGYNEKINKKNFPMKQNQDIKKYNQQIKKDLVDIQLVAYKDCKQKSLKKAESLQKKAKFMRAQRKVRKNCNTKQDIQPQIQLQQQPHDKILAINLKKQINKKLDEKQKYFIPRNLSKNVERKIKTYVQNSSTQNVSSQPYQKINISKQENKNIQRRQIHSAQYKCRTPLSIFDSKIRTKNSNVEERNKQRVNTKNQKNSHNLLCNTSKRQPLSSLPLLDNLSYSKKQIRKTQRPYSLIQNLQTQQKSSYFPQDIVNSLKQRIKNRIINYRQSKSQQQ